MTDELAAFRRRLAEEQAERELWARIERRAAALSWWIASHPCPTSEDFLELATDPDLEDANAGFQMLIGLGGIEKALEFLTVTYWTRRPDDCA